MEVPGAHAPMMGRGMMLGEVISIVVKATAPMDNLDAGNAIY
jgi:hypothetical protein